MRHAFWVSLLVGSLAACNQGSTSLSTDTTPIGNGSTTVAEAVPITPGTATGISLQLRWQANTDPVAGYRVYFGGAATNASTQVSDLPLASSTLDPAAPAVTLNAGRDLGLDPGASVCFRLRAYNDQGALSDWSPAACTTI